MAIKEQGGAISKRLKISEAQQNMIVAVLVASLILGVSISLFLRFSKQIAFNAKVLTAKEEAVVSYSNVISKVGICKSPKGKTYTEKELKECDPNTLSVDDVQGTLRYNILNTLAENESLDSVPVEDTSSCINSLTGVKFTYLELKKIYEEATDSDSKTTATNLMKVCSPLRVISDAMPSVKNEEALLASLNKIFLVSGLEPDTLASSKTETVADSSNGALNTIPISLEKKGASTEGITELLTNMERSIRNYDINDMTIEWKEEGLLFKSQISSYYVTPSSIIEKNKTVTK